MRTFHARIASLDKTLYDGEAVHCRVRTPHGAIGFEARHAAFLAELEPGSRIHLRRGNGEVSEFPVSEGMLTFRDNQCTILVGAAS